MRHPPRIACLYIPCFVAEVELRQSVPNDRPLLITDGPRVLGGCERAAEMGVTPGDLLRQALVRCPQARVIQGDRAHYQRVWQQIVETLGMHSPVIEEGPWGLAYLEAHGMGALYGSEADWCRAIRKEILRETSLSARLGVAGSKFASMIAAQTSPPDPGRRIIVEEDRAFLAPLPTNWLPLSVETRRRLRLLGLHTIGQFAKLPANTVAEQFGPVNLEFHRWARGKDERPLRGRKCEVLEAHAEFEVAEAREGALLEALLAMGHSALQELQQGGLAIRRLELEARLAEGETLQRSAWIGATPGDETLRLIFRNLLHTLQGESAGVVALGIKFVGLEPPSGKQLSLFAQAEDRTRLEEALRRLARKHSAECVAQPCELRPEAPLVAERYALQAYRL